MIELSKIDIKNPGDYDKLNGVILSGYINPKVIDELKERIGLRCNKIYVEYPYYDGDYLSSYYIFHAKKHKKFPKECYRVHLMKDSQYFGYLVLRPTICTKFGKSYINPAIILNQKAYLTLTDFKLSILGNESTVKAYPWMSQETDISVCAHVACWSIIRYFGNRFRNYADKRMSQIIEMTPEYIGRKVPSEGLNILQVSEILKNSGFSPLLLKKEKNNQKEFLREVLAYIESGIPLVGAMTDKQHAIALLGHGSLDLTKLDSLNANGSFILTSDIINSLIISDDNYLPYIELYTKDEQRKKTDCFSEYSLENIDFVVAPLYDRMYLRYASVIRVVTDLFKVKDFGFVDDKVVRIYITSANSLKKNIVNTDGVNLNLKRILLQMSMPKFVWCVDISSKEEYEKGLTSGRVIIDSTAGPYDREPWLLIHDGKVVKYFDSDNNQWYKKDTLIDPYPIYKNNLMEV